MPRRKKENPIELIINLHEVIKNKQERNKYSFTYEPNGLCYYNIGEQKINPIAFDKMFPIEFKRGFKKGENSDRTKNWINDLKSY
jgi:hypothetical protein